MMELSIVFETYNHIGTVRRALESVLVQKLEVPFEILLIDDGSTDGTTEVLKEYKEKYPDKIRLFTREYNSGNVTRNSYEIMKKEAQGKYFAFIEGDDYWIDDEKLKKQYEILEKHPGYSAVTTDVMVLDENDNEVADIQLYKRKKDNIFGLQDYNRLENPGMSVTVFSRNPFMTGIDYSIYYTADHMMGDMTWCAVMLLMGDIYQMDEKTAVYRYVTREGCSNFNSLRLNNRYMPLRFLRYWIRIENFLHEKTDGNFCLKIIDEQIMLVAKNFEWKDLYIAVKETWNKKRIVKALWFRYVLETGKVYPVSGNNYIAAASWRMFQHEKKALVLFGAGNLAAEFLDYYAWQMPVLFLVDNDSHKIGRSYKGYIIKHPREILHFRDEVAVVVTNEKYEKEICEQLKGMGILNYYCYWSMQRNRMINRISNRMIHNTSK